MVKEILISSFLKSFLYPGPWSHFIKFLQLGDTRATNPSLINDLIFCSRVNSNHVSHNFYYYLGINVSAQNLALFDFLCICTQVTFSIIPSDSRLSAICRGNQTPVGVKMKLL